jgi:hypothetical protein
MPKNALFRNLEYDKVRFIYARTAFPSGSPVDTNYAEASGNRYYYSILGSSASDMEAATFNSFISVTMSGGAAHFIDLVPLLPGELVHLTTTITAVNDSVSKGLIADTNAAYINTGTEIKPIGGTISISYNIKKDFMTASVAYVDNGTASVGLLIGGELGENLDWNIFVSYKKGFHSISSTSSNPSKPIYPQFPTS